MERWVWVCLLVALPFLLVWVIAVVLSSKSRLIQLVKESAHVTILIGGYCFYILCFVSVVLCILKGQLDQIWSWFGFSFLVALLVGFFFGMSNLAFGVFENDDD